MRYAILLMWIFYFSPAGAQILMPGTPRGDAFLRNQGETQVHFQNTRPQWFLSSGTSLVSDISFSRQLGPRSWLWVPSNLQLNRRLNDHWYAFANLTLGPTLWTGLPGPGYGLPNKSIFGNSPWPHTMGVYSAASIGVYYTNEARTFSISGSISTIRSSGSFPGIYPILTPPGTKQ